MRAARRSASSKELIFLGGDNGGKAAAVLYSMMASAKADDMEPFVYLRNLLARLPSNSPLSVADLLPDAWPATHPEARRRWSREFAGCDPHGSKAGPFASRTPTGQRVPGILISGMSFDAWETELTVDAGLSCKGVEKRTCSNRVQNGRAE